MLPDTRALGLDPGRLGTALTAACRAPSLHNSQPWRFRVGPDVIELWADPERVLAAADPEGREQRMACGAALLTLRLALRGFGVRGPPSPCCPTAPGRTSSPRCAAGVSAHPARMSCACWLPCRGGTPTGARSPTRR
jgi:hypothetical protein